MLGALNLIKMFKKGEYIVLNYQWFGEFYCKDFIFKQIEDSLILEAEIYNRFDSSYGNYLPNSVDKNGYVKDLNPHKWTRIEFRNKDYWRYATKEEINIYNKLGHPFNINFSDIILEEAKKNNKMILKEKINKLII